MFYLPVLDPLATAGAPLTSTILVVGAPLVVAVALGLGVLATVLCVTALRTQRRAAPGREPSPQGAMPYAAGGAR